MDGRRKYYRTGLLGALNMNFGDILDKWEKQNTGSIIDVKDKDRQVVTENRRRRLKTKKPDAELDIHGLTRDEAWLSLEAFFAESRRNGLEKILIIHGKGNHSAGKPVLKRTVMEFIERCPYAGESGRGKASDGGEGTTWVLLKDE